MPENIHTPQIVTFVAIIIAVMVAPVQADARTAISIVIGPVCAKTACIKVSDILKYDNSTESISGKFIYDSDAGDYQRAPGMKNSLNWYTADKLFVFVAPDAYTLARSKQIVLTPSLGEFALKGEKKQEIDFHTTARTTYEGVWVGKKCDVARVGVRQHVDLDSIISHLAGGCKSELGNQKIHIEPKTKLNYCGQECQHQKFMKDALAKSKKNLLGNKR
jgi:hypothetical protein